jgi:hypothetical protein
MDRGSVLDLTAARAVLQAVELRVDHHRGPVGIGVVARLRRAQRNKRIRPPRIGEPALLLVGHSRDLLGDPFDRSSDDRSLTRRQLRLQPEPPSLLEPPPRQGSGSLGLDHVLALRSSPRVASMTHGGAGHPPGPDDQIALPLGRGEPRELDYLVEPELPARQGLGQARETLARDRRRSSAWPSARDAVAHREPVLHVASAGTSPALAPIRLPDQGAFAGEAGLESRLSSNICSRLGWPPSPVSELRHTSGTFPGIPRGFLSGREHGHLFPPTSEGDVGR